MKRKSVLGAALALTIMGGALTACSDTSGPIVIYSVQPAIAYSSVATPHTVSSHILASLKNQMCTKKWVHHNY